jgi:hypothetical protein
VRDQVSYHAKQLAELWFCIYIPRQQVGRQNNYELNGSKHFLNLVCS